MQCPVCRSSDTKVIDSRSAHEGLAVRRRRQCTSCEYRFSTVESVELLDINVIKEDDRREGYDRRKLRAGIERSLAKRPYTEEELGGLIHNIERDIQKTKKKEVPSAIIGDIVMRHLQSFDTVAYIRFASIYRAFEDVDTFKKEIKQLGKHKKS